MTWSFKSMLMAYTKSYIVVSLNSRAAAEAYLEPTRTFTMELFWRKYLTAYWR